MGWGDRSCECVNVVKGLMPCQLDAAEVAAAGNGGGHAESCRVTGRMIMSLLWRIELDTGAASLTRLQP